jgi:phospholipid transport system substrate-binding protein
LLLCLPAAQAEELHPALAMVKQTTEQMLARLRSERDLLQQDKSRVNQLVEEIILPHFDFDSMSASVLGKYWRTADAGQRQRFRAAFKSLLLRTYAYSLVDNMDREIEYEPMREQPNATDVTVRTTIPQDAGFPIPINYSLELIDGAWKVYDVEIDGLSLVKNYRSSFAKDIDQNGLEHLIETLENRNKDAIS